LHHVKLCEFGLLCNFTCFSKWHFHHCFSSRIIFLSETNCSLINLPFHLFPAYLFTSFFSASFFLSLSLSLCSTSAPSHHVNYTTVLFLYYSPLCYFCHPHCCACFCYVGSYLLGSAVVVEMRWGRALLPNSTTNGCLASSDWHRLEGSLCCCGGDSCRRWTASLLLSEHCRLSIFLRICLTILMALYSLIKAMECAKMLVLVPSFTLTVAFLTARPAFTQPWPVEMK